MTDLSTSSLVSRCYILGTGYMVVQHTWDMCSLENHARHYPVELDLLLSMLWLCARGDGYFGLVSGYGEAVTVKQLLGAVI